MILFTLDAFSFFIGLGASCGLVSVALRAEAEHRERFLDAGLITLVAALLGGRVGYVLAAWPYFSAHLGEAPLLWLGGFTWEGALLGGLLGLALTAWRMRLRLAVLADGLLPLLPPVLVGAWLGAWQTGVAYGSPAAGAWWGLPGRDEWGVSSLRFPLQPLGALLGLALFFGLDLLRPRLHRPGQAASLALLGLSVEMLSLSLLRADPGPTLQGLRWETWGALSLGVLGGLASLLAFGSAIRIHRKTRQTLEEGPAHKPEATE